MAPHFEWLTGEPDARKRASPVRRGAVGKGLSAGQYLAGRLPYRKKGAELQIVALADQEGMTCVEVPVLLSPDDDPYFEESSWRDRVAKSKSQSRKR